MHELSLALEVARIAESHLDGRDPALVRRVAVEVGDEANIEVENFQFCLEAVFATPPFAGARPTIVLQPGPDLRLAYLEVDDGRPDN